ncbi:MFS transporter [Streptomyces sp. BP-8]|uniref:MFS transporter n=1 Tax=Streptomyces sirii TaxID=3127701 RepID=A0ABZ2QYN3_9ACTN
MTPCPHASRTGTLGASLSPGAGSLIAFRFVIGVGIASVVVPLYLTELAPQHARGGLTSLMQLLVTVGIFVAYVTDYLLAGAGAWRWMIGLGVVPAAILALGIITQPESPRWLVGRGRVEEARTVLTRLRGDAGAAGEELAEIERAERTEREQSEPLTLRGLASPRLRPVFAVAVSWGPVRWVMLPELFPMRIRAAAVGLCVLFNWLFNRVVALVFPSLLHAWGAGAKFLLFAGTTLPGFLFVQRLLPETKGRSLEEIEADLLQGRADRRGGAQTAPVSSEAGAAHRSGAMT